MAVNQAAAALALGHGNSMIAGGVESMSRAPYVVSKSQAAFGRAQQMFDTTIGWRFTNPKLAALYHPFAMGETAENVAKAFALSRQAQDEFALTSQQKYAKAQAAGLFADELIPISVPQRKGDPVVFDQDEYPRAGTTAEKLSGLRPAFVKEGSVTAANASGLNDGAAAVVVMTAEKAAELGITPLAKISAWANAGVDPAIMGIGPVPATQRCLNKAGWEIADLDLIEANEAFAVQALSVGKELGWDAEKVNVNGGAIALGHPIGASGTRILVTLLHEMQRRNANKGLATLCIGGGQGVALAVEKAA